MDLGYHLFQKAPQTPSDSPNGSVSGGGGGRAGGGKRSRPKSRYTPACREEVGYCLNIGRRVPFGPHCPPLGGLVWFGLRVCRLQLLLGGEMMDVGSFSLVDSVEPPWDALEVQGA
jgi:hypothetical protein